MKVVYLHQYFNTADVSGSVRSYEFARRLVRAGHEVHIVTSDRSSASAGKTWDHSVFEGINVHSISQPYSNSMAAKHRIEAFLRFAYRASLLARSLRGDVVFATSTPLTIALPALVAILGRRTPFVMEVRDLWPTVPIAMGYLKNPVSRFLARLLERTAYRRATSIIALSHGMADGIRKVNGPASQIAVIPNMSDTARFQTVPDEFSFDERYPQLNGRPFVIYTGTFGRVNGVDYMARLAKAYGSIDSKLAFVAMGDGSERERVIKYGEELEVLNRNFFVFDPVPKKDLPLILSKAIACSSWVIPVKELEANSANKLFDAFAAAKPMIINHGGWQQELLEGHSAGLALSSTETDAAALRLSQHLSDTTWVENASRASARLGREHFEVEKLYQDFERVLIAANSRVAKNESSFLP